MGDQVEGKTVGHGCSSCYGISYRVGDDTLRVEDTNHDDRDVPMTQATTATTTATTTTTTATTNALAPALMGSPSDEDTFLAGGFRKDDILHRIEEDRERVCSMLDICDLIIHRTHGHHALIA